MDGTAGVEPLLESERCVLYRERGADGEVHIVKALRAEPPDARDVEILRHELQMCRALDARGILRPVALARAGGGVALLYEDFDGLPLRAFLSPEGMDVLEVLRVGAQAADALAAIHRERIIHKNVQPGSLLVGRAGTETRLTDFSLSCELLRERPSAPAVHALEGDLRYVSPEQTGRMNRTVDHRSDLYSLGVTLYEMLTGQLPFVAHDPLELVHAHIAREPPSPRELRPAVPDVVARLVLRLLAKRGEDRYQSAAGLRYDLEQLVEQIERGEDLDSFVLGSVDRSEGLVVPETLLGRDAELARLMAAFDRAAEGEARFLLVAGYSGVGKSALIREIHRPVVERHGEFVSGKFDQFRRAVPYSALSDAFGELVRRILTEPRERVDLWRERVAAAVGESGAVLVEFLPELELLLGTVPPVADLSPVEAEARFRVVFERFVHAVAKPQHPLVLFVDDLQWADLATLELIQRLVRPGGPDHFFLIGAYRDNEVDASHPLQLTLDALARAGSAPEVVQLEPLREEHVAELVRATLETAPGEADELAALVHGKTGGNPFFVQQFLHALYEGGHLAFDAASRSWTWDLERIRAEAITSNVVELMARRIASLPEGATEVVQLAACLGNEFEIDTLALVASRDRLAAAADLWPAVAEGLVVPVGDGYRFLRAARGLEDAPDGAGDPLLGETQAFDAAYRFLHDRVQQAAYGTIEESRRPGLHLRIGRLLREDLHDPTTDDRLFDVVNHLDAGIGEIDDPAERSDLAGLNRVAGERARSSSAWAPAATYFATGRDLLPPDAWERAYELALTLHRLGAEAEYMRHDVAAGERLVEEVLAHARDPMDTISVYDLRIHHEVLQARMSEGLAIAMEALGRLGVTFPRRPNKLHVLREIGRVRAKLVRRSPDSIRNAGEMTDPRRLASLRLLLQTSTAAYQSDPNMLALIICKEMELVLEHGNCSDAPQAICSWAILVGGALGWLRDIYDYGELGVEISRRYADPGVRGRASFHFDAFSRHWRDPLAESVEPMADAARLCAEGGDLQFYAYSLYHSVYAALFSAMELTEVVRRFQECEAALRRADAEHALPMSGAALQFVQNLRGESETTAELSGEWFDADERLDELRAMNHQSAIAYTTILRAMLAYLFGDAVAAARFAAEARPLRDTIMALPIEAEMIATEALAHALLARGERGAARRRRVRTVRRDLRKLRKFAGLAPTNYSHVHDLVRAELASLAGREGAAVELYERAVAGARGNGYTQYEGVAAECAARHHRDAGRELVAAAYVRAAVSAFTTWGAGAKVAQLRERHARELGHASTGSAGARGTTDLDVGTVVRASQVVSKEIVLDRLLTRLLRIVLQNAGAQRGALVRIGPAGTVVEAHGTEADVVLGDDAALESVACRAVVDYARRTREAVVIDDAQTDARFQGDPYVREHDSRSILAVPTVQQGEVTGCLYVENDLSSGAFTEERVELLRMVASQAAISLTNARLYTEMAQLNRSYERFVPRPFLGLLGKDRIVDVVLGDHVERELVVLFADIRGFTSLSESMEPSGTFAFLNSYLGRMEPLVRRRGGVIDKYVGDALMALFEGRADEAVRTALDMARELELLNRERADAGERPVRIGIGVNRGRCMLGTIGGHDRMDGTVIGDAVNVASRLESLTKELGAQLLLGGEALDSLSAPGTLELRPLGRHRVKGRAEAVRVFEVLDALPPEERRRRTETREDVSRAVELLESGRPDRAAELLAAVARADPGDRAVRALLERTR